MTRRALLIALLLAVPPLVHAAPRQAQDLTGKWSGSFIMTVDGQENPDVA
jgi:hypothetical protein